MTNPRSSQAPLTLHASLETGTPALAPPGGAGTQSPAVCDGTAAEGEPKRAGAGGDGAVANGAGLPGAALQKLLDAAAPFVNHDWYDAALEDDNCQLTRHSGPVTVGDWRKLRLAFAEAQAALTEGRKP